MMGPDEDPKTALKTGEDEFDVPVGIHNAGLWAKISFSWAAPMLAKGWAGEIRERTASAFIPPRDRAPLLAQQFEAAYTKCREKVESGRARPGNLMGRALLSLFWRDLLEHTFWVLCESAIRLVSPFLLRELLSWIAGNKAEGDVGPYVLWRGWLFALLLGSTGYFMTLVHHQLFWIGMRMGFEMRQQAIAAIQAKVLRLNSASISEVTTGQVVNLVSNDVRRFDDAMPFWVFMFVAPLELCCVLLMLSLRIGFVAAICGVATLLLLIPAQAALVNFIGRLRDNTARFTDERVRLESEAISGALAMKMLGWEEPLGAAIRRLRGQEMRYCGRMNLIRAFNMALQFLITPVVAFITFSVMWAEGRYFSVATVFYTLALLALPQMYMAIFFVRGVETLSELRISLRRLNGFLALPEPPVPSYLRDGKVAEDEAGTVEMRGADFDWRYRGWARTAANRSLSSKQARKSRARRGAGVRGDIVDASTEDGNESGLAHFPLLAGIRFALRQGELLGICGEVGSGKSSVLAALLGELQPVEASGDGPLLVGRVAYCSQVPWVVAGTLRENVTFGQAFEEQRYWRVVRACALMDDITALPAGDMTELGERGINLSGGQKARLGLARAAYSGAEIALLDDPLSAVDPRVGTILFGECIGPGGIMQGMARVLVTHQRQYLPRCDRIIVLRAGRVFAAGTYDQLLPRNLPEMIATDDAELDDATYDQEVPTDGSLNLNASHTPLSSAPPSTAAHSDGSDSDSEGTTATKQQHQENGAHQENAAAQNGQAPTNKGAAEHPVLDSRDTSFASESTERRFSASKGGKHRIRPTPSIVREGLSGLSARALRRDISLGFAAGAARRRLAKSASKAGSLNGMDEEAGDGAGNAAALAHSKSGRLTAAEGRQEGTVEAGVYWEFVRCIGLLPVAIITVAMFVGQGAYIWSQYWLATWANKPPQAQQQARYVWVYAIFTCSIIAIALARSCLFYETIMRAGTRIHNSAAARVLRAPLRFFHTNPTGRVLNRFSKDQGIVDEFLPQVLFDALQSLFMVLGAFVLCMVAIPFVIPLLLPLLVGFWWVRRRYIVTSRAVKRFEATTRSPVFASFSAALKGLPTIRAYAAQQRFRDSFLEEVDLNGSWWFMFIATARWIGFRLDVIAALTLTAACILVMAVHSKISLRLVGLALSYVLQLTGQMQWAVRQSAEAENNMTSVERLLEYTRLPQEPPTVSAGGGAPPKEWPQEGTIEYQSVTASYRPGLPAVLENLSFRVAGGTSCGVVGRTGSGKSSLLLTLFRLIDVDSGHILLDGVDTSKIGLDALRRQLAIIPQDPVLFSGTLRSNLDPWDSHSDARLWEALESAQLKAAVTKLGGLDASMAECGDNLSVGQRQLFCLARALLQDAHVLALDEATANVDRTTDALIQTALRNCTRADPTTGRRGRTLLVIAHRIDTIMDCDQLLVLSAGRLVESGAPSELATRQGGTFARLVRAAEAGGAH